MVSAGGNDAVTRKMLGSVPSLWLIIDMGEVALGIDRYAVGAFRCPAHHNNGMELDMSDNVSAYFSGKYESAAAEVIAVLSVDCDYTGESDAPGGYVSRITITADDGWSTDELVADVVRDYGVTAQDVIGHHIVTGTSSGAVYVESYATGAEADDVYRCAEGRYAAWLGDDDDDVDADREGDVYVCPVIGHGYHNV